MPRQTLQPVVQRGVKGRDYLNCVKLVPIHMQLTNMSRRQHHRATQVVSIDVNALSTTISTVVAQAVQSALSQNNIAAILMPRTTDGFGCIEPAVASATDAIVVDSGSSEGTGGVPYQAGCSDPQPRQVFTSIVVGLTSRVGAKLKGKIWANEYVDFGYLLFSSPGTKENTSCQ